MTRRRHRTTPRVVRTRRIRTTWLGVRGEAWEYLATSDPFGERVCALRWLEDNPNTGHSAGDLSLRHMTGDGRRPDAVVHAEHTVAAGTDDDALTYALDRFAATGAGR